ncbi:MAG: hypothetical protein M5U09_27555 [Gammaproteobacteria bacterium]|nr:hypothetical protein [Gammaproteobacteria bacterium]
MFEPVGAVPLSTLFAMGEHLLVARPDFPEHHAWLVAHVLSGHANEVAGGRTVDRSIGGIPAHAGAMAHARGEPPPEPAAGS